ncbi:PHD finger protein 7-like [Grus japonensis]|uniref:PHD finger protein 7-like n=1 Tax=Grus japonensis TaxID=30415 RepID=A0ABC9XKA3_GRUJA
MGESPTAPPEEQAGPSGVPPPCKRKRQAPREEAVCGLCRRGDCDPEIFGQLCRQNRLLIHENCLYHASRLMQRGADEEGFYGFLFPDIRQELKRVAQKSCCICRLRGASVTCKSRRCRRTFHFPCGSERGCISQFFGEFKSCCWTAPRPLHRRVRAVQHGQTPCLICLEAVAGRPTYDTLVCPACASAWFHRRCIQGQALRSALHYFRCPLCRDMATFQAEMFRLGIKIPDRSGQALRSALHYFRCPLCRDMATFQAEMFRLGIKIPDRSYHASRLMQRGADEEGFYGFLFPDIRQELKRVAQKSCCICRLRGASVTCKSRRCRRTFHFPCGSERGCISQFFGEFKSFCWKHRPVQRVRAVQHGQTPCLICLEAVAGRPTYDTLVCPACASAWFHRRCIQGQALRSALHYFCCPLCRDMATFQAEMFRLGIKIPDRSGQALRSALHYFRCPLCRDMATFQAEMFRLGIKIPDRSYHASRLMQRGADEEGFYGFLFPDIRQELKRVAQKSCCICRLRGASVTCKSRRCRRTFHFPCGSERGCISQFFGEFKSFCWKHRPVQRVRAVQHGQTPCLICLEAVAGRPTYDTLVCPACASAWFHRRCIQGQALRSALHYFCCPLCRDMATFQAEMFRLGIKIPDRSGQALRSALHHFRCPLCRDMATFQAEMFRLGIKIPDRSGQALRSALHYFRCPLCRDMATFQAEMFRLGIKIPDRSGQALRSALHYFCCPLCRDMATFQAEMFRLGIKIPDRDAAWEEEDGAFADHYERHSSCDAGLCLCLAGREQAEVNG